MGGFNSSWTTGLIESCLDWFSSAALKEFLKLKKINVPVRARGTLVWKGRWVFRQEKSFLNLSLAVLIWTAVGEDMCHVALLRTNADPFRYFIQERPCKNKTLPMSSVIRASISLRISEVKLFSCKLHWLQPHVLCINPRASKNHSHYPDKLSSARM